MTVEQEMTRTERRRLATHGDMLLATRDGLLEHGPAGLNARIIARLADHAVATFYNHFTDVDAAIDELVEPRAEWAETWARRIIDADDFREMVTRWIADFLVRLPVDGAEWEVVRAANRPLLDTAALGRISEAMVASHRGEFEDRGVAPGRAGSAALHIMVSAGDLYGGRTLAPEVMLRLARVLHAVHWGDPATVDRLARRSVDLAAVTEAG